MRVVIQISFLAAFWAVTSGLVMWLHPDARLVMKGGAPAEPLLEGEVSLEQALVIEATGKVLWVDVRPESEYRRARIPGAENMPEDQPGILQTKLFEWTQSGRLGPDTEVIIYCASPKCGTSHQLRNKLLEMNALLQVHVLAGGWPEWQRGQPGRIVSG